MPLCSFKVSAYSYTRRLVSGVVHSLPSFVLIHTLNIPDQRSKTLIYSDKDPHLITTQQITPNY